MACRESQRLSGEEDIAFAIVHYAYTTAAGAESGGMSVVRVLDNGRTRVRVGRDRQGGERMERTAGSEGEYAAVERAKGGRGPVPYVARAVHVAVTHLHLGVLEPKLRRTPAPRPVSALGTGRRREGHGSGDGER